MVREALVLAGGFGTRLSGVISSIPKPMAPVNGRPFLEYLLDYLSYNGINHVILSTGHLSDVIAGHFGNSYKEMKLSYSVETKPLGTGGALFAALDHISTDQILVLNGDTLFKADIGQLSDTHRLKDADISIALRYADDVGRFGAIVTDPDDRVTVFSEKSGESKGGWINGGLYLIQKKILESIRMPEVFSLERDLFAALADSLRIYTIKSDGYFIDIGTAEDYQRAASEL